VIDIQIFTRHHKDCKVKRSSNDCNCKKQLRWTVGGVQYKRSTKTRDLAEAEGMRRKLRLQLEGRTEADQPNGMTVRAAVEAFVKHKDVSSITKEVVSRNRVEMMRFADFCERNDAYVVGRVNGLLLTDYKRTWPSLYQSTGTQHGVQKRLKDFLSFCADQGWLARVPVMAPVKITEAETQPLDADEYKRLLAAATNLRTRLLIELMRHSGLAVRDASTLRRDQLVLGAKGKYYIATSRQKTGAEVRVPIPVAIATALLDLPGDRFFCDPDQSGGACAQFWGQAISRAFDAAGITSLGQMKSHRLRDSFAVGLLAEGFLMEDVSRLMGISIVTCERHYAKWSTSRQDRIDGLFDAMWNAKP
jgi:integrase